MRVTPHAMAWAIQAPSPDTRGEAVSRAVGGLGMLVGVAVLLMVPLVVVARAGMRRRRESRVTREETATPDAWRLAGRRMGEDA